MKPSNIIRKATNNMNKTPSEKYGVEPDTIGKKSLASESFRITYDFHRLKKIKKNADRLNKYENRIGCRKKTRLRQKLQPGGNVLVLAERLRKKDASRKHNTKQTFI